ncbi:hypothetical protein BC939DRAFT_507892 [Gamsiella multidivaricata]|uniref:uncharacterized protein n=1 Tax=Gamsiella multidivaricata TaxID=101098 RepID=UPI00221FFBE0|nr:uncharacterized protein BC939DRAFT_507892 [Gamsiella multidivaricata]KAG0364698.1 hypothetical protein BGZ54_007255 [Gamsiella multidivaricata]KAI7816858.1 hypothetical protein BC939DRAFT_507892 [Gamsiella multidivaricata]
MTSNVPTAEAGQAQPQQPPIQIGRRIEVDYSRGTVRYLGEVPPTKGEWIGVEWDGKERGKHSGEHNGTKYFNCLFPGTGSFIRLSSKIQTGNSLLQVLKERYVDEEKDAKAALYLGQSNVVVDVYDFERVKGRQSKLHLMEVVGLANTNVATASGFDEMQKACPAIRDLDLSSTLLCTWKDVANICAPLTKLDVLRLNRNRFQPLTTQPSLEYGFKNIQCLALNRVFMPWDEFELLEPSLPNLRILQIGYNLFSELGKVDPSVPIASQKVKGFANLENLHLEGNAFTDWNQILRLSRLPKLESLDLSENKIESILGPQDEDDFKLLTSLRLTDNSLKEWTSIDQLGRYTSLRTVWIGNNPLTNTASTGEINTASDPRITAIARMPHIQYLNGSEISKTNRIDAEIYYLKNVAMTTKGMDPEAVHALHPRFEELCEVHGRPDTGDEYRKATSEILKDRLIAITLVSKDSIEGPAKASFQRNVLGTMTVKNLKNLAQKLLKIPAIRQELVFLTNDPDYEDVKVNVTLKDDMRQISYYDVSDGEVIMVLNKTKLKM